LRQLCVKSAEAFWLSSSSLMRRERSPPRLILEIDIGKLLASGTDIFDGPGRREAAMGWIWCHNADIRVGTGACQRPSSTETTPNRIISTIMIGQSFW
jgi:hypothetical protein